MRRCVKPDARGDDRSPSEQISRAQRDFLASFEDTVLIDGVDGEAGAYWAMLGPGLRLRRTDFDRQAAAKRIRAMDWPAADEFARSNVINVPSIDEAMNFLRKAEAKQTPG